MVVPRGEAPAPHQDSEHEGEPGGVGATGGSGQRGRADPERVVQGDPAGERERPGAKASSDPDGTGHAVMAELVALRAILLNVMFKLANGQP
jgi:hypothetical protein